MSASRFAASLTLLMFAAAAHAAPADLDDGLLVADPADVSLFRAPLETLTPAVVAAEFPDTTSVLVFKDDRLVFERYFGAGGINVLNNTRSVTKTLTALIVGQALVRRRAAFRRSARVRTARRPRTVPNDGPLKRGITLMDLLTMSSALDCNDFDERNVGNEENMYPLTNWSRWVVDLPVKADYVRNASGRGPFSYCTGGTLLLGQIVQRAVRKPLDQYFDERLFRPLGIRERQWSRSPSGEFMTRRRPEPAQPRPAQARHPGDRKRQLARRAAGAQAWVRRMQTLSNVVNDQQSYGMLSGSANTHHLAARSTAGPCRAMAAMRW